MDQIDFIGRILSGVVGIGFLIAGIFDVLDYFIVKFLLFGTFIFLVLYMFIRLYENENHPES
ncbi:hypothetical protein [Gelidibacter japonicus]|uniref:hypothetical protein n=1 Tax=Gelidibacter japonicus TaxID=1962232 RepID=UPI003A8E682E